MLLGNYSVLNRNPVRYLGGGTATPEVNHSASFYRGGARKNRQYVGQTTAANKQFSLPYGGYPSVVSLLAQKGGDLSARRSADFSVSATATGVLGMPGTGTASMAIAIADAAGQLISSGNGTASFSITAADLLLTASLNGVGTASFVIDSNSPLLGALASGEGSSAVSISIANADILPVDDASPMRSGTATITFSGDLTPYAIGSLSGSTADTSSVVNANIVAVNGYAVTGNGQSGTEWGPA